MPIEVGEDGRYAVLRTSIDTDRRLSDHTRKLVLRRDRYRCVFCGDGGLLEVDHIIPWSAGGSDDMDNLRTLCRACNQDRSNFRVPADDHRRLPNGHECVYCTPHLIGEGDVTAVYCVQCNKKAPGLPADPMWHPDVAEHRDALAEYFDDEDSDEPEISPEALERARIARLVAHQRAAAPPQPLDDEPSEEEPMKDWTGTRVQVEALEVGCVYCHAPPGEGCVAADTGKPLQAFPAHTVRIRDAKKTGE